MLGVVKQIHSDQGLELGLEFACALIRELCSIWGIKETCASAWRLESNSMIEHSNKTIKAILHQMDNQTTLGKQATLHTYGADLD